MLTHLSIRNILLLKHCDIAFAAGLNVLTGETGAGKSILLDALGLVLGERSDTGLVRHGEAQASVSAEFDIHACGAARALMAELELPGEDRLLLRRTLAADGKSRAFVNDAPVSAQALKRFGEVLVARHGQHDQRGLLDNKTHREVLDTYALHGELVTQASAAYVQWKAAAQALEALAARAEQAARDEAWLRQTVEELGALDPQEHEEETLVTQRKQAAEARQSLAGLQEVLNLLAESGGAALQLRQASKLLSRTAVLDPAVSDMLSNAESMVEEVSVSIERAIAAAEMDPAALEAAEDRLHALRGAARKYNVAVALLPDLLADARVKVHTLTHLAAENALAKKTLQQAERTYREASGALYQARAKAAERLCKAVVKELKALRMGDTQLRVVQSELPPQSWGAGGMHQVSFEVATNAGMPFGALNKVASGGELSRLLLAMKVVLHAGGAPTSIFDEIDTGTGGAVAEAMGVRLKLLGQSTQVLVVTHAPQVAALAQHHLFIRKSGGKQVSTQVEVLDDAARREELARMLSGATISDEARKAAGKLLQAAV
ncbi:MAG: DNA repair protein RecN [Alphaproteobacteria bacterium]|nr:DNA repair protein RecN [Alphaproteobacteria bacterium]